MSDQEVANTRKRAWELTEELKRLEERAFNVDELEDSIIGRHRLKATVLLAGFEAYVKGV